MSRSRPRLFAVLAAATLSVGLALPAVAQDDPENGVCGPDVDSWDISVSKIGPLIAGTWTGTAPGMGFTQGVQTFTVNITLENGRLYMSGNGAKIELKPVRGARKPLRYDFVKQQPLPKSKQAVDVSVDDFGLVLNCDMSIAPQFTWSYGMGARRSSGVYTFGSPTAALGTMWNSAQGAREVYLSR